MNSDYVKMLTVLEREHVQGDRGLTSLLQLALSVQILNWWHKTPAKWQIHHTSQVLATLHQQVPATLHQQVPATLHQPSEGHTQLLLTHDCLQ